jgi:hypothetical protein
MHDSSDREGVGNVEQPTIVRKRSNQSVQSPTTPPRDILGVPSIFH